LVVGSLVGLIDGFEVDGLIVGLADGDVLDGFFVGIFVGELVGNVGEEVGAINEHARITRYGSKALVGAVVGEGWAW
jgi:hypothetical protein